MFNSIYAENVTDSTSSKATSPFGLPFVMGDWTPYSVNIRGAEGVIFRQANPERETGPGLAWPITSQSWHKEALHWRVLQLLRLAIETGHSPLSCGPPETPGGGGGAVRQTTPPQAKWCGVNNATMVVCGVHSRRSLAVTDITLQKSFVQFGRTSVQASLICWVTSFRWFTCHISSSLLDRW